MTTPTEFTIKVKGMSCGHCVRAVTQAVQQHDAQAAVDIDLPSGTVRVRSNLPRERVVAVITEEGYEVLA